MEPENPNEYVNERNADPFDEAKEYELNDRRAAIRNHQARVAADRADLPEPEYDEDGNRICACCTVVLDAERLEAEPDARLCVPCKSQWEKSRG
ncbi:hypothetical protein BOW53_02920 [Solemya pervernicosa gill symbiont]|uniref:Uncharacterized protein n=1 Tax=Solemya pervernicosa gill symbiont TaxID=642797 RepID=A0A1T2L9I1_9GAMM|nr:hypothetical protein BOW53_02920 [Solemya pervernicosa gill symbiont]